MGFLPFKTRRGDRIFMSVALTIAIALLWLRYVEKYMTIWGALVIGIILSVIIMKFG